MKKITIRVLLLIVIAAGFSNRSAAQNKSTYGVRGGINIAWLQSDFVPFSPRTTFNFSAFYQYYFYHRFSIQPEVSINGKGSNDVSFFFATRDVKLNLTQLEVPVLLKYNFLGRHVTFSLMSGASVGFNLAAEVKSKHSNASVGVKELIRDTNYSLVEGFEIGVPLQTVKLIFDARYDLGLVDVVGGDPDLSAVSISAGVGF